MDELENMYADEITGTIQRLQNRQAVRYMPEGQDAIDYQREYAQSIQFENGSSINFGQLCMRKRTALWLSNHMQLSEQSLHW
jgi:hypothetical protein